MQQAFVELKGASSQSPGGLEGPSAMESFRFRPKWGLTTLWPNLAQLF